MTHVDLNRVDWYLFNLQKVALVETIADVKDNPQRRDYLNGLLHLLDHVQDTKESQDRCESLTDTEFPLGTMCLQLFHGRADPDQDMEAWGEPGPIFVCPHFVHSTYCSDIKLGEIDGHYCHLSIRDDLVFYAGM